MMSTCSTPERGGAKGGSKPPGSPSSFKHATKKMKTALDLTMKKVTKRSPGRMSNGRPPVAPKTPRSSSAADYRLTVDKAAKGVTLVAGDAQGNHSPLHSAKSVLERVDAIMSSLTKSLSAEKGTVVMNSFCDGYNYGGGAATDLNRNPDEWIAVMMTVAVIISPFAPPDFVTRFAKMAEGFGLRFSVVHLNYRSFWYWFKYIWFQITGKVAR